MENPTYTLIINAFALRDYLVGRRKSLGLTQADMAQKLNINQQNYARFEAHPEKSSVDRLLRVFNLLDAEVYVQRKPTSDELNQLSDW